VNERAAAEEHLRVIRSLMERATVYRAISAPTAVVGGALSLAASVVLLMQSAQTPASSIWSLANPGAARHFILLWSAVLILTLAAHTVFIWRKANREGSAFFTSGLKLAISSVAPVLLVTAALTFIFWQNDETAEALPVLVVIWITCYGLALLATSSFAPVSLRYTGWAFLLTGVACLFLLSALFNAQPARAAVLAMAATFGLYNLVYGFATWPRKRDGA